MIDNNITVAVIVNKDSHQLDFSETFLHAHINLLPCRVVTLIGNPGYRYFHNKGCYVPSRSILLLSLRWLARKLKLTSVANQDKSAIKRFIRRNNVNLVLAEYGTTAVTVMHACVDAGVPLVAHFHGYDAYREKVLKENHENYQYLFKHSSAIIAVSWHMYNKLVEMGASQDKLFHNPCGAEINAEAISSTNDADKSFIMVGRLVEKKAPFVSILAFKKVVSIYPDVKLKIVGDGPLRQACEQLCIVLDLQDCVTFYGACHHEKVIQYLSESRWFVQHSVRAPDGDREGTPVGLLEAMGIGLPVVSTRHGGILDIIQDGETGLLVDEYDVDGMAKAMLKIVGDSELSRRIGRDARMHVLESHTLDMSVSRLWSIIYQQVSV